MKRLAAWTLASTLVLAAPALAQNAPPDSDNGRYSFSSVSDGMLRLDSRTGQVSLCSKREAGWACQIVPDERAALETEIGRLQSENAALKKEMIARGIPLPAGMSKPESATKSDELSLKLPSDADLERVMSFFEKAWRRLMQVIQSTQREMERGG